jgi:cell wall-associated NlpC family hydrolase
MFSSAAQIERETKPFCKGLVGIPFRDRGRDRSGADCWGLVRLVYAQHGVDLASYAEIGAKELLAVARAVMTGAATDPWSSTSEPYRKLDVVVMKRLSEAGKAPVHVGVMLDWRRMLHTTEAVGESHIVRLGHSSVPFKVLGVHRHRAFA